MSMFQSSPEEIEAYFRITRDRSAEITNLSNTILKTVKGNVPASIEQITGCDQLTLIEKGILIYALGRSIEAVMMKPKIEKLITGAIQKGIEIGTHLPPDSSGQIEINSTDEGIAVTIKPDPAQESDQSTPAINQSTGDKERMYQ